MAKANRTHTDINPDEVRARLRARAVQVGDCMVIQGAASKGYMRLRIRGEQWLAHRLAYTLEHGPIPEDMVIDHACHNRRCITADHLQAVTVTQNNENRAKESNSTSGIRGVSWSKKYGKWTAQVGHAHKATWLGYFTTIAEAEAAVVEARIRLHTNNLCDTVRT